MATETERVEPDDIEAKLRELAEDVDAVGENARSFGITVGAAVVVGVVIVAFWLGRRRGRKAGTIVEIRRV